MRNSNSLTALKITRELKRPGLYGDGGGLYLQIQPSRRDKNNKQQFLLSKSWIFRYMRARVPHKMGLGPLELVSLAEARDKALAARKLLLAGIDPIKERNKKRAEAAAQELHSINFRECSERYILAHRAGWKNAVHARQWETTLATYAYPILGTLAVGLVDTAAIMRVLEQPISDKRETKPFWQARPETASRLRGRIEATLDWATARGYRVGENPARWRGHIDKLL